MKSSSYWFLRSVPHFAVALAVGALTVPSVLSESVVIYEETFAGVKNTSISAKNQMVENEDNATESPIKAEFTDHDDWTGISLRESYHAFRFGNKTGTTKAMAKSGAIALANGAETATVTVSFYACSVTNTAKALVFSVLDSAGGVVSAQTITPLKTITTHTAISNAENLQTVTVENVPTDFHLKFAPGQTDARIFVGGITVTQEVVSEPVDPDTPTFTGPDSAEVIAGGELSFEVSAALADSTAVDVVFDGIEPTATTTPAFAEGVFTWSPAKEDVGTYTASFHATANGTDYPFSVALTVLAPVTKKTLLSETFPGGGSISKWTSTPYSTILADDGTTFLPNIADLIGWTGSNLYYGIKGVRLGKSTSGANPHGAALSPLIHKSSHVAATPVQVSFYAAKFNSSASDLKISIVAEDGTVVKSETKKPTELATEEQAVELTAAHEIACTFTDVPSRFRVLFEPTDTDSRIALDTITVTRELSDAVEQLAAPVNVVASEVTQTGFALAWDAVASASGYEVLVTDATGAVVTSALTGTNSATLDGLANGTSYSVSVVAVGDDVAKYDSEWSDAVSVTTVEDVNEPEWTVTGSAEFTALTAGTFTVGASLDANALSVSFDSISPELTGTSPVWDGTVLSWTPSLDDVGSYTITFTTQVGENTYRYDVPVTVADLPPLKAVKPELSEIGSNGFRLDWVDDQIRTDRYGLRIWYGTDDPSNATADVERFLEYNGNTLLIPLGWSSQGTGNYDSTSENRVQFGSSGSTLTTKRYLNPVTEFSYEILRKGTGNTDTEALFRVEATADDATWTEVASYQGWDALIHATHTLTFDASVGYRRFRFVFANKSGYNVALNKVSAVYEGAGAHFAVGSASDLLTLEKGDGTYVAENLHPERVYYVEFVTYDMSGTSATSRQSVRTQIANPTTVIVLR